MSPFVRRSFLSLLSATLLSAPFAAAGAYAQDQGVPPAPRMVQAAGTVRDFYVARDRRPLWMGASGLTAAGAALLDRLDAAAEDGLDPAGYDAGALRDAVSAARGDGWQAAEFGLSQALVRYIRDLRYGRTENGIDYTEESLAPQPPTAQQILKAASTAASFEGWLGAMRQVNPIHDALRNALGEIRRQGPESAPPIIPQGAMLRPGDRDPRVPALRARLDVPAPAAEAGGAEDSGAQTAQADTLYDDATVAALRAFQREQGIRDDGIVGPNTLAVLNRKPRDREALLIANMERARWLPRDLGRRHLIVNIPEYRLHLYEDGRQTGAMDVVVGDREHHTPLMADRMEYMAVNPFWNVPPSIVAAEIAPAVQRGGVAYLRRNNMEVVLRYDAQETLNPHGVNWAQAARGNPRFLIRQRPGPQNSLGQIKFMFPNPNAIYLHDTPAKALFDNSLRAESHGCVRVARPMDLAQWVLKGGTKTRDDVEAALDSRETQDIALPATLPVYLHYFTAWPEDGGAIQYSADVYERDAPLMEKLGLEG